MLLKPYKEKDIFAPIQSIGPLKSPRPDDFDALFFNKLWDLLKPWVMNMIRHFQ